jgi:Phytanoyl-CoA dioxygenase (PhyH)
VEELRDSAALAGDPDALRARLVSDGYLFLRAFLPAEQVGAAGVRVRALLRTGGWTDRARPPAGSSRRAAVAGGVRDAALLAAMASRPFNRIPYLPPLRGLVRGLLGPDAFSYPIKVLRTVHPETGGQVPQGRHIHQDFAVGGVDDMLTTWVPLMPIPRQVGGLAVLPGSHRGRPRLPRLLSPDERGWASTDYQVGDVLLFHCLTSHAALPNRSGLLRLSQDSRWQYADLPAPARMVYGPPGRPRADHEMFSRLLGREPWWEPIPPTVAIKDDSVAVDRPRSRLFRVHPTWALWRMGNGQVH